MWEKENEKKKEKIESWSFNIADQREAPHLKTRVLARNE